MATRKSAVKEPSAAEKKRARAKAVSDPASVFTPNYEELLDDLEKKARVTQGAMSPEARKGSTFSSNMLGTDLMLSGGLIGGRWYTFFGGEGSAKSTGLAHIKMSAADTGVAIQLDEDYEGSAVGDYYNGILEFASRKMKDVTDLYGLKDHEGNVIKKPRVRYYNPTTAEEFFNPVASLLRKLPDKVFLENRWWYAWDADKRGRAMAGNSYSKSMYTKHQRLFIEAQNGLPQAIFYLDSYPAMFPEALDDDDAGRGMAAIARAMSENVPKIFPKLRPKNVTLIGVNQLRQRPGFNMGDPSYEPAGDTIKFASSVRVRQTARSVPHGKGPIEKEASVLYAGAYDTYRYIHMKTIKNKVSTPYLEAWQRVWVDDSTGTAHGFCPVWDTFQYLKNTGQLAGNMKKMRVTLGSYKFVATWDQFKALILLRGESLKRVLKQLKLAKDPQLRLRCFHQLREGDGLKMYFETLKTRQKEEA